MHSIIHHIFFDEEAYFDILEKEKVRYSGFNCIELL